MRIPDDDDNYKQSGSTANGLSLAPRRASEEGKGPLCKSKGKNSERGWARVVVEWAGISGGAMIRGGPNRWGILTPPQAASGPQGQPAQFRRATPRLPL